jgi:hypothetical protein
MIFYYKAQNNSTETLIHFDFFINFILNLLSNSKGGGGGDISSLTRLFIYLFIYSFFKYMPFSSLSSVSY